MDLTMASSEYTYAEVHDQCKSYSELTIQRPQYLWFSPGTHYMTVKTGFVE